MCNCAIKIILSARHDLAEELKTFRTLSHKLTLESQIKILDQMVEEIKKEGKTDGDK